MLSRCLLFFLVASLAVSAGALRANPLFVDISATDGNTQAWPTGVSAGGAVVMQGLQSTRGYFDIDYYPGGTTGTMTNVNALFNNSSTSYAGAMNDSGQFTAYVVFPGPHYGWLDSGGTVTNFGVNSAISTLSLAINSNGDEGGTCLKAAGDASQAFVRIGGTCYPLNSVVPTYSATITALNTSGQAVGWADTGDGVGVPPHDAEVWSYAISGGSLVSQNTTDLQNNGSLAAAYPGVESSQALAINSSGTVVIGASNSASVSCPNDNTAYFLYNMNTHAFTSLGSLMLYDPIGATTSPGGGHDQAINNAGQVVGQIAVSSGGYDAAIWQNGTVTDLNTKYAGILPAGFTLNNATAIDNNGDIAGWGTDASGNTNQAFVIINPQLPGDANLDGRVDVNDLTIVLAHFGQTGTAWTEGEFTGSGKVDINDLTIVLAHFGQTAGSAAGPVAAVPEPSTLVLIGGGAIGLLGLVGRRSAQLYARQRLAALRARFSRNHPHIFLPSPI